MFLASFQLLDRQSLQQIQEELAAAEWSDGRGSAGYLSQTAKQNLQLAPDNPIAQKLSGRLLQVLNSNESVIAFALPLHYVPPQFNLYRDGQHYARHIDGSIRPVDSENFTVRTDLAGTVFLSDPESYQGGELCVEDGQESREIKLSAGEVCIYSSRHVHQVKSVSSGQRLAAFFWIQSLVRNDSQRQILHELDKTIQRMGQANPSDENVVNLANIYHNLLREWAET